MARNASIAKLGYYPLSEAEAKRIRQFLRFPTISSALDPCAGTGAALRIISDSSGCRRYGVELDTVRAATATEVLDEVIQGSLFETHCPVDAHSLLYLNPPYMDEVMDDHSRRSEGAFLEHCYRWLQPAGVLVLVIPGKRLPSCETVLAVHFRDLAVYKLTDPEAARFSQVVVFAVRRSRREREKLPDSEVHMTRRWLSDMGHSYQRLSPLTTPEHTYIVPPGDPNVRLVYRGLPLDLIEDALPLSRAYRQAGRAIFAAQVQIVGRPLTPLHEGHAGILSCSGILDGIFGKGTDRHVACWQARKVVDHFEEEDEKGVITIRDRERFTQALTLIYADGRTKELSEDNDAERTSANGTP
jgi:SAM-dependent methyltransferase